MTPGSNILHTALSVLGRQCFEYIPFQKRTTNAIGMLESDYLNKRELTGSVQPVPRSMYGLYGLDFQKNYVTFFVEANILDVARDIAGDKFIFAGKTYTAISKTDWFSIDCWVSVLAVQVPNV